MNQKSYDNSPSVYIIPTPIGNMEDITLRALRILKEVDIIFAEDTRTSKILLKHYDINTKITSSHLFNEEKTRYKAISYLEKGQSIAVISDQGTPVISDPGYLIVKEAINEGYNVICLPGATAVIPAVVMSGLAGGPFTFYGFLNSKETKRKKELEQLKQNKYPIVFYESPHRLTKTLKNLLEVFGNRKVSLAREISKKYEEIIRDSLENVINKIELIKGEIVIVVDGNKEVQKFENISIIKHIELYIEEGLTSKEAIKKVAKERNIPKSEVYNKYLIHKDKKSKN